MLRSYNIFMKIFFEGTISCKAILEGNKRQCDCLYVDRKKRTKDFSYIIHLAKKKNVDIQFCSREQLDELSQSTKHGGMLLEAGSQCKQTLNQQINGWFCYVDGIEDPYNLGSICRTLYASGCNALVLPNRDWNFADATIVRASAGAFEKMDIYWINNEQELVDYLKKYNIPLLCAHRKDAIPLYEYNFPEQFCACVGGSFRGLSSLLVSNSTQNIVIPYGNEVRNALDAPSAISVISFEVLRQRNWR